MPAQILSDMVWLPPQADVLSNTRSLKLFWDNPPWHAWHPVIARAVARCLSDRGVMVSALASELGRSVHHTGAEIDLPAPRIVPYRNERYGLQEIDFDDASTIDVRVSPQLDETSRFGYSPAQIHRWTATADGKLSGHGGGVPTLNSLPDLSEFRFIAGKVAQLRKLAPRAEILVSIGPERLGENLADLAVVGASAIGVRLADVEMSPVAFRTLLAKLMDDFHQVRKTSRWLIPPRFRADGDGILSTEDMAKLFVMGWDAIALDGSMDEIKAEISRIPNPSLYVAKPDSHFVTSVNKILSKWLDPALSHVRGLVKAFQVTDAASVLGSFDPIVSDSFRITRLGGFR